MKLLPADGAKGKFRGSQVICSNPLGTINVYRVNLIKIHPVVVELCHIWLGLEVYKFTERLLYELAVRNQ